MRRSLLCVLLLVVLGCLASTALAQTSGDATVDAKCSQCHITAFLAGMTAGNAYNCNAGAVPGVTQCGWAAMVGRMRGNAAMIGTTWLQSDVDHMVAFLESSRSVANPSVSLPAGTAGVAYGPATLTGVTTAGLIETGSIHGGVSPFTWSTSTLPSGMTLSAGGVVSGMPAVGSQGTYTVTITIRDSSSPQTPILQTSRSLVIAAAPPLSITGPASLSAGTLGVAYSPVTFTATGGTGTGYTWSATSLPSGMGINSSTGSLSGTPTASGSFNPQFTVKDSSNATASVNRALTINSPPVLSITGPASLSNGTQNAAYSAVTFTASGGTGGYSWTATNLPTGMGISAAGVLSGTPTVSGSFNPQFTVKDSSNATTSVNRALTINPAASTLNITGPASLSGGTVGVAYSPATFTASGGTGTGYTWTATGLPTGMAIAASTGILSGTPASGSQGSYTPQFAVKDSGNNTASVTRSLTISPGGGSITITAVPLGSYSGAATSDSKQFGGSPFCLYQIDMTNVTITVTLQNANSATVAVAATSTETGLAGCPFPATPVNVHHYSGTGSVQNNSLTVLLSADPANQPQGVASFNGTFAGNTLTGTLTITRTDQVALLNWTTSHSATLAAPAPGSLSAGITGALYGPVQFAASGGSGGYTWSAIGLPSGLAINSNTGVLLGTPPLGSQNNYNPQFTAKDSNNTTATVSLPLAINPGGCSYALSAGGQAFSAVGGNASLVVTAPAGCSWSVAGAPNWVTFSSSTSGSGNATISYQVFSNTGASRSASLTVAGLPFAVEQAAAFISGLATAGSLAQIASAGTWATTFTYVNNGGSSVQTRSNFFGDSGSPLMLPLTFPQSSSGGGALLASVLDRTLGPGASLIISATGPDSQPAQIGLAQLQTTGAVGGFAIFSNPFFKWNAVVPLETRNASAYLLAYDNTGVLATGLAIANLSTQPATVSVVIRDDQGVIIGTSFINLPAQGHTSFMLSANYPVTFNKRGTIEFDTPPGGQISVLGLRANGPALTTLPVLANVTAAGGSLTQATYNGGFTTQFTLVNTGSFSTQATLSFFDNSGTPLNAPLFLPQTATTITATTLTRTLVPGASLLIQTRGQDALPAIVGSAQLTTTGPVSGFAIFNWTTFGQEASVPLETRNANSYVLAFDNTNGLATGLALANVSNQSANVTVIMRDDTGALLQTTNISLSPNGHTSFLLTDNYAVTANKRGTIEFVTPTGGRISALGLRAKSDGTLTTIPVFVK